MRSDESSAHTVGTGPGEVSVSGAAAAARHSGVRRPNRGRHNGGSDPSATRLQGALSELAELKRTLVATQKQATVSRRKTDLLSETNARLTRRLLQLSRLVEHARHFAYHDELTGLPNRALLLDRLRQAMVQAARRQQQVALLFLDLDQFKSVNDKFGHAAGDRLLQHVAGLLSTCIRGGDTVCRFGGDEFVIMLPEIDGVNGVTAVVNKIRARLAAPFSVDGHLIAVAASIGAALYPDDGRDCDQVIRQADIAMYQAKVQNNAPGRYGPVASVRYRTDTDARMYESLT